MRIRGIRERCCEGPVLSPSHPMCICLHGGFPCCFQGLSPLCSSQVSSSVGSSCQHRGRNVSCLARTECNWNGKADSKSFQQQPSSPQILKDTQDSLIQPESPCQLSWGDTKPKDWQQMEAGGELNPLSTSSLQSPSYWKVTLRDSVACCFRPHAHNQVLGNKMP